MAQDGREKKGFGKIAQKIKENKRVQELAQKTREVLDSEKEALERDREIERRTAELSEYGDEIRNKSRNTQSISRNTQSLSRNTQSMSRDTLTFKRDTGTINREDIPRPKPVKKLRELEELEEKARQAADDARKETISFKREALKAAERERAKSDFQRRATGAYTKDELKAAQAQQRRETGSFSREEVRLAETQQRRVTGSYTREELRAVEAQQRKTAIYSREEMRAGRSPQRPPSPHEKDQYQRNSYQGRSGQKKRKFRIGNKKKFGLAIVVIVAIIALIIGLAVSCGSGQKVDKNADNGPAKKEVIMEKAETLAAMYDYDGAIELLKTCKDYENDEEITTAIAAYEGTKSTLVEYPVDQITHVFFHALLVEPEVSFGENSPMVDGFNIYMTTLDEFNKIIQSMYDKGYVLVSLYDIAKAGADGVFQAGKIMLPEGKKAFVLSEDDVCYYHAYDNGGIADKLVIDEKTGKVKAQYTHQDGSVEVGDFDVLPALDTFVEEHPDFSYHGAKGILALTGYNGILGYRTDTTYDDSSPDVVDRDSHEQAWIDAHPGFDYKKECEEAKKVAEAIKEDGWYFASHSWGHKWQSSLGIESFTTDTTKWMTRVAPLIGGTDIWIYSNGEDVDTDAYQDRFQVLLNNGFRYFCTVNSVQYSTRIDSYGLNQGRRNLDGYRMYYDMINDNVDKLSDLFDVNAVFDQKRPTPVPQI